MTRRVKATAEQVLRLERIGRHLGLKSHWPDDSFWIEMRLACLKTVAPVVEKSQPKTGEMICKILADHYGVQFEEVHSPSDIQRLKHKYLKGQGELGFGRLDDELRGNDVDALLFQRTKVGVNGAGGHIAVLNLQGGLSRAYWNKFHELAHRIAEPQQGLLPFRRHKFEAKHPVERGIDYTAAYLAFYPPIFGPFVETLAEDYDHLTIDVVEEIRERYAPSASLQSTVNAVIREWPRPALALAAEVRGKKHQPEALGLRVSPQARNGPAGNLGIFIIPNMRVPKSSPVYDALLQGEGNGPDDLSKWVTSSGKSLSGRLYSSAIRLGDVVYAILSTGGL